MTFLLRRPVKPYQGKPPCLHLGKLLDKTKCGGKVHFCDLLKITCSPQKKTCQGSEMKWCGGCESHSFTQ